MSFDPDTSKIISLAKRNEYRTDHGTYSVKEFEKHRGKPKCVILCEEKDIIVSSCIQRTIHFMRYSTGVILKKHIFPKAFVGCMILLNDNQIVCGDNDAHYFGFSLDSFERNWRIVSPSTSYAARYLYTIGPDSILTVFGNSAEAFLAELSFSKQKIVRKLISHYPIRIDSCTRIIPSQTHENCVVINCGHPQAGDHVILVNYRTNKVIKQINLKPKHSNWIYYTDCYQNQQGSEIVMMVGSQKTHCVSLDNGLKVEHEEGLMQVFHSKKLFGSNTIFLGRFGFASRKARRSDAPETIPSLSLRKVYERGPFLQWYDMHRGMSMNMKDGEEVHLNPFEVEKEFNVELISKSGRLIRIACRCNDGNLSVVELHVSDSIHFMGKDGQIGFQDLKERIDFVFGEIKAYLFEQANNGALVTIKIGFSYSMVLPKTLLCVL